MKKNILTGLIFSVMTALSSTAQTLPPSGATETTPSKAEYFSWINHSFEGGDAVKTKANLDFFKWLKDTYGMQLDIYLFDAGTVDGGEIYGDTSTLKFKKQFPEGFGPISKQASEMNTALGLWAGPDGFGNTTEEAKKRADLMIGFVKDGFRLFKFDLCCSRLYPNHYHYFDSMFTEIRKIAPDLVALNHRLDFGPCTKYMTTFLFEGMETYVDVHFFNDRTASHHRVGVMTRKNPANLTRLTEDHGVCISSCIDYWEDDLILQAFNRNMILAPEIYGNPWLMRDDEYSYLAYIFNLHRDYRDILAKSVKRMPEAQYGPEAITRGDGATQFLTLRNLTWNETTYHVSLNDEVGLANSGKPVQVRLYHPYIEDYGKHSYGSSIDVKVPAFRSVLLKVTTEKETDRLLISGVPYQIINDRVGDKSDVKLLGTAGKTYKYNIQKGSFRKSGKVTFQGEAPKYDYHRKIAGMTKCEKSPDDISSIYYATCFAADNNTHELRSLKRSGETKIKEVQAARDAFFSQELFKERSVSDRYMFDDDTNTDFAVSFQFGDRRIDGVSSLMIDFGEKLDIDRLNISTYDEYSLYPHKSMTGSRILVSDNLVDWKTITFLAGVSSDIDLSKAGKVRYAIVEKAPLRVSEINAYKDGARLNRDKWRASNLFQMLWSDTKHVKEVWKHEFTLDEIQDGAYLCVAIEGEHGREGAFAGFKIDGEYVGCPDRAPSYECNPWECPTGSVRKGYTYYLPLTKDMVGKKIEAYAFSVGRSNEKPKELSADLWISAYPIPFKESVISF